jgi:hypothetical protein
MNEQQQAPPAELVTVTLPREDLELVIGTLTERCREIAAGNDFDRYGEARAIGAVAEELESQRAKPEHEKYAALLRATAELRYPERTPELQSRIEKTIARKVGEFTQERQAKQYEAGLRKELAERHPQLTPEQAQRYERRINELVAEYRQNQAQREQQQDWSRRPDPGRHKGHGRGMEQSL